MMVPVARFGSYEVRLVGSGLEMTCTCSRFKRGMLCGHIQNLFSRKPKMKFDLADMGGGVTHMRIPLFAEWPNQRLNAAIAFTSAGNGSNPSLQILRAISHKKCAPHVLRYINLEIGIQSALYFPNLRDEVILWSEATVDLITAAKQLLPCESFLHSSLDDNISLELLDSKGKCEYLWTWLESSHCARCFQREMAIKEPF